VDSARATEGGTSDAGVASDSSASPQAEGGIDASMHDGAAPATPVGWSLVAIDTPLRTYLDYVDVPDSGVWTPEADGWPLLAQWQGETTRTGMRFQSFSPGQTLTAKQILALLPALQVSTQTLDITAAPYNAAVAPADATTAIQNALTAAGKLATPTAPVDVLVPAGTYNFGTVLTVPQDVRLRGWPEGSGGTLAATDPANSAVHLSGDRAGALFLTMSSPSSTARLTTPQACGIWIGGADVGATTTHDTIVVGNEVVTPAAAHVFAIQEEGGLWAFNYAHDGFADTFHHTGTSSYCQVVGNRAKTSATQGDDLYAFVGYQSDGDPVHHCACLANWGQNGAARGLSAVGAGFIDFENNSVDMTQWAGIYLAQESSFTTYGTFNITAIGNTIDHANLGGSHDGVLAYSDDPTTSTASASFGMLPNLVRNLTVHDNSISNTSAGVGNGFGIEIRASTSTGDVSGNTLTANQSPQLVIDGTGFTQSNNTITP
jgi:hypothetical protein